MRSDFVLIDVLCDDHQNARKLRLTHSKVCPQKRTALVTTEVKSSHGGYNVFSFCYLTIAELVFYDNGTMCYYGVTKLVFL